MANSESVSSLPDSPQLWQQTCNWRPTPTQQEQFQRLYAAILAGNRQLNLTRILDPEPFWEKHLWDSLRGVAPLGYLGREQETYQAIDIGTGAGFPGIPLAIAAPSTTVTLLDSTRKKIAFLDSLLAELNIANASAIAGRAEEIGRQKAHREAYDLALLRAVGSAATCAEYALPLLKLGGTAVLYRGNWMEEERDSLAGAIAQLGGQILLVSTFTTPLYFSIRHCIYLRKESPTPAQFPRAIGLPAKTPLA